MSLNSGTGSIPVAGCCRILALPGFRRPTIAGFRQSNIKHACKDEEFTVKPKMIFVDHYFRPYQTP
jgi:hypothetical protein